MSKNWKQNGWTVTILFSRLFDGSLPGLGEPGDYAELLHLEDERGQAQPKGGVIPRKLMRAQTKLLKPI